MIPKIDYTLEIVTFEFVSNKLRKEENELLILILTL